MPLESSFRVVVDAFESFTAPHKQIHSFHFGSVANINTSGTIDYMMLQLEPTDCIVRNGEVGFSFLARIMDMVKKDKSNLKDVLSDTHQVMLDTLAHLKINGLDAVNGTLKFHLKDHDVPLRSFWDEEGDDERAGWMADFTLWAQWDWNECAIPN